MLSRRTRPTYPTNPTRATSPASCRRFVVVANRCRRGWWWLAIGRWRSPPIAVVSRVDACSRAPGRGGRPANGGNTDQRRRVGPVGQVRQMGKRQLTGVTRRTHPTRATCPISPTSPTRPTCLTRPTSPRGIATSGTSRSATARCTGFFRISTPIGGSSMPSSTNPAVSAFGLATINAEHAETAESHMYATLRALRPLR